MTKSSDTVDATGKPGKKGNTMAFVKVEGIVGDHLGAKGFILLERITNSVSGQSWDKKWTVWASQPHTGAFVEAVGELRADIARHWETKELILSSKGEPLVNVTINDATVKILRDVVPAEATQWDTTTPPAITESAPF